MQHLAGKSVSIGTYERQFLLSRSKRPRGVRADDFVVVFQHQPQITAFRIAVTLAVFAADLTDPTAEFDSVNAPVILLLTASFRSQDWIFGGMAPMSNDSTRTRALPSNGVDLSPAERASVGPFPGIRWRFPARPGAPGSADFSLTHQFIIGTPL